MFDGVKSKASLEICGRHRKVVVPVSHLYGSNVLLTSDDTVRRQTPYTGAVRARVLSHTPQVKVNLNYRPA